MGEQLRLLLRTAERVDPGRRGPMLARSDRARDLAVGDIANQEVSEGVLALACDRRAAAASHELLSLERVQQLLRLPARQAADRLDRTEPEDLSHDGCVLKQQLLLLGQGVEACRDDPLDGVRQLAEVAALEENAGVLLGVERVAARSGEERLSSVGIGGGPLDELLQQLRRLGFRQRGERDRRCVRLAAAPAGAALQ